MAKQLGLNKGAARVAVHRLRKGFREIYRADIYALGVVFYRMLTGELPGKMLEPPSKYVSIDVRLDEVGLRALEQKPELRYQQASVLKTQVETIVSGMGSAGATVVHL